MGNEQSDTVNEIVAAIDAMPEDDRAAFLCMLTLLCLADEDAQAEAVAMMRAQKDVPEIIQSLWQAPGSPDESSIIAAASSRLTRR